MKIVFVHLGIPFDGDALKNGPLGGTETALIGVTRELAKIAGNEVFVFTNTHQAKIFEGVQYFPLSQLVTWGETNIIDVLVSIRQWLTFWLPLQARLKIYFSPDAHDQPFLHHAFAMMLNIKGQNAQVPFFAPHYFLNQIDAIFCVGEWQAKTFVDKLGFPQEKIFISGNGVFLENFKPLPLVERKAKVLYSSTPFRGLDHLIRYFPQIKSQCANAQLEVCSGMGVYGVAKNQDNAEYGNLYAALKNLGAISHGSIKQSELAQILSQGRVYAYPNTFEETFCISVLEAQAAGLVVVTSNKGALPERITHGVDGFLISGNPGTPDYDREFITTVQKLLTDDVLWQRVSHAAVKRAQTQTYFNLALSWQDYFVKNLINREPQTLGISALEPAIIAAPFDNNLKLSFDSPTLLHFANQAIRELGFLKKPL